MDGVPDITRGVDVTQGWEWRQPGSPPAGSASPWWSDAPADPWRDPYAPAAYVQQAAAPPEGALEPVSDPDAAPRRGLGMVLLVSVVTALLAGALGGALGYTAGSRSGGGGTLLGGGPDPLSTAVPARAPDSLAGVAKQVLPSVVTVRVAGSGALSVGSGFVVSGDGYVITNEHVVAEATGQVTVAFTDGSTASASVVGKDPESDLAVIKVAAPRDLVPVRFGDSEAIAVGDPVLAFGSPLALSSTVTSGIVSAVDRAIHTGEAGGQVRYYAAIQTDAAINQGNSGGPLVNGAGQVVGVNSVIQSLASDEEQAGNIGLAFAIPINQAKRVAQEIIATGKARRTVFGAQVEGPRVPSGGVRLSAVESGGPAAGAGLRAGDVVTKIDGRVLQEASDLIALVRKYAPGAVVTIEYRRGSGGGKTASVTLAADAK
ncbi:MAG TPA: trypsin-like peptidase domain-containing protein [Pilimelia sp.]|nr:trypsin-like peptidase domain-containing protein [Pilimelia sp.]